MKSLRFFASLVFFFCAFFFLAPTGIRAQSTPDLSRCLLQKGFVMYGTRDCPNCELQKSYFGESFASIRFVDCDAEQDVCQSKKIRGYPTWEDTKGNLYRGVIPLSVLAQLSGCENVGTSPVSVQNSILENTSFSPILLAFLAGLLSFLAPCCLPLFPAYFSVITGFTFAQLYGLEFEKLRGRVLVSSLFFVTGFVLIYTLLGAVSSVAGKMLESYLPIFLKVSGVFLIFLGLVQVGAIKFNLLEFDYAWKVQKRLSHLGFITAFVTGIAAALSWIPCIGPLLSPILLLAAKSETAVQGSFLLFIYGLGLTVPFILGGLFFPSVVNALRNHRIMFHRISQIAGLFLVLFGVVLLLDKYQTILDIIKININDNALQFWNFIDKKIQI